MSLENDEYYNIIKREKLIVNIFCFGASAILFTILLLIVNYNNTLDNFGILIFGGTLLITLVFYVVFTKWTFPHKNISAKKYFDKIGQERLIARYNYLLFIKKEYLKFFIGFLVIFGMILYLITQLPDVDPISKSQVESFIIGFVAIPGMIAYALQITQAAFYRSKDFDFFYSTGCFNTTIRFENLPMEEKSKLIQFGLDTYNNFLRFKLRRHIANLDVFYLKIISESDQAMLIILNNINKILDPKNKLEFLRYLTTLYGNSQPEFLVRNIISKKLIEILAIILGPIITVLVFSISVAIGLPSAR